jgi:hypothetical protein
MAKTNVATKEVTKKAVAKTQKPAPAEKKTTEKKSAEKKPAVEKFDAKAYAAEIVKTFKGNKNVDIAVDTELEYSRSVTLPDYSYIHFFKKGTEKDLFKMYNTGRGTRFAVSKAVYESGKIKEAKPVLKKNKKGEKSISYADIVVDRSGAVEMANKIIETYMALV